MSQTEANIVAAFGELLEEKPYNKITVKEVTQRCGVNRNTFYYYFENIPSLLQQTIENMINEVIRSYARLDKPIDCFAPLVRYATKHKKSVLHIYRSTQREIFQSGLDQIALYASTRYMESIASDLPPAYAEPESIELLARYYKCVIVGMFADWLDKGMEYDLLSAMERIAGLLCEREKSGGGLTADSERAGE